jgi:hypothetical protein
MKLVFVDCEFTGEHAFATLVSIGMVTLEGEEFYTSLNDYNKDQVTDWLQENVLTKINENLSISSEQACKLVSEYLEQYSQGDRVSLISAGKLNDILLLFQLWHSLYPWLKYFHFGEYLPSYLNHRAHFDLDTLFWAAGLNPNIIREDYVSCTNQVLKHNSLYDAKIVRQCFLKMAETGRLPEIVCRLNDAL